MSIILENESNMLVQHASSLEVDEQEEWREDLFYAVRVGDASDASLQELLAEPRAPEMLLSLVDENGNHLVHFAAANGHTQILQCILSAAKHNAKDLADKTNHSGGNTALHWASLNNKLECCKVLVDGFGANPNPFNNSKRTPCDEAEQCGHTQVLEYLLSKLVAKEDINEEDIDEDMEQEDGRNDEVEAERGVYDIDEDIASN